MTECERLIEEGKLEASFLEGEERCGFVVTTESKKIWALSIDMLEQIDIICKRHGLQWFAIGGTAIGAVRHSGFIPWDDDIDVAMKREDYNVFLKAANEELPDGYFLQTPETDPYYVSRTFAKLRNNNTTCINFPENANVPCNNGLFVDIFPLDGYENNRKCNSFVELSHKRHRRAIHNLYYDRNKKHSVKRRIWKALDPVLFPGGIPKYYRRHEERCTRMSEKGFGRLGLMYDLYGYSWRKWHWDRAVFDDVIWMPFEYSQVPVPVGYDNMLTEEYGEYMKFPENIEKTHPWECDMDMPYKAYCSKKYGVVYD